MTTLPDPVGTADPAPPRGRFNRRRSVTAIITILMLVEVISAFETSMVFAAIPTIIDEFHSNAATVGWAVTAFLLVGAASAAVCGRIGDMYGRERVLVAALAAAVIGSLVSALAGSVGMIIAGRAIQGVAAALLPLCIGLAREHLPKAKVPVAVAVISGTAIAAGAAAAYIAGLMIDHASWHMIFIVSAVYGAGALLLVLFVLPWNPPVGTTQKVDYIGALTFAPAIAAILLGITKSGTWGWSDGRTLGLIGAGLVVLALWVVWELRVTDPIANLQLFTDRRVALTMVATLTLAVGPFGISNMIIPMILQSPKTAPFGIGMSPSDAGLLAFVAAMIAFAFTPLSGRIARTVGSRISLSIGCVIFLIGTAVLFVSIHSAIGMFFGVLTTSIATSFAYTALPNLIVEAVPPENTSEASGLNAVFRSSGQGIGTSVASTLLASSALAGTAVPTVDGLNAVLAVMFVGTLVTLALGLMIRPGSVYSGSGAGA